MSARGSLSVPIGLGLAALFVLGGLLYYGGKEPPIERTATGMKGAVAWLRYNGVSAHTFSGRVMTAPQSIGLRILPLYDTNLNKDRTVPTDREGTIVQTSEIDIDRPTVLFKIRNAPTLIVLPKWRTGMRALGAAHKDLLIPIDEIDRLMGQLGLPSAETTRDAQGFVAAETPAPSGTQTIGLMHAQSILKTGCRPEIGHASFPVLVFCLDARGAEVGAPTRGGRPEKGFWLLTDPDLIANHGLVWENNGQAFLDWVNTLGLSKPAVLDLSVIEPYRTRRPLRRQPDRTWENFARLFEWPFMMVWIAFGALGLLVLWRALVRYGPVARSRDDEPLAAKITSIDAKARLLRLADHDLALLKAHITARLGHVAAEILGPHRPQADQPLASLRPVILRANPTLAEELDRVSQMPGPETDILRHLDAFETCIDRIRHEFGRPANAG